MTSFLQVYFKYKFALKAENAMYTREEAASVCREQGAELWEVTGGRAEWEAVAGLMDGDGIFMDKPFWLGAEAGGKLCPKGKQAATRCNEDMARLGFAVG